MYVKYIMEIQKNKTNFKKNKPVKLKVYLRIFYCAQDQEVLKTTGELC